MMKEIRAVIRLAAPKAEESISYGMPFYAYKFPGYHGRLTYFGAFTKHISLFIIPRKVPADIVEQLSGTRQPRPRCSFRRQQSTGGYDQEAGEAAHEGDRFRFLNRTHIGHR